MTLAELLQNLLFFAAMLVVLGFAGGLFIGKRALPERVKPALALWLVGPLLAILIIFWREGDPAATGQTTFLDTVFAFVIYSLFLGVPYVVATLVGFRVGRAGRGTGQS